MNQGTNQRPYKSARQSTINGQTPSSRWGEDHLLGGARGGEYYDIVDNCLDITRNTSIGRAVINVMDDFVGGNGLTPSIVGSEKGKQVFQDWARGFVNVEGTKNLSQILHDIIVSSVGSGDVLITTPMDKTASNKEVGLRVELTSGARVRTPDEYKTGKKDKYGNTVKMGVAFKAGKEVGYYVQNLKQFGASLGSRGSVDNFTYVSRFDSKTGRFNAYLFRLPVGEYPEQTRGLPMVFPVVQEVKDLSDLWDSAITGARNKNMLAVVVSTSAVSDTFAGMGGTDEHGNEKSLEAGTIIGDIVDGAITTMPDQSEIKTINSSGMIDLDALFLRSNRYLCSGIGIPMEILLKDFSQTNFSSGKLAMDSFFRKTEYFNVQLGELWRFLYELVNVEASLKGFGMRSLNKKNLAVKFVGSQNFVDADPGKNSKAEAVRISTNVTTATQELARKGMEYGEVLIEKAQEFQQAEAIAKSMNVPIESLLPQWQVEQIQASKELEEEPEEVEEEIEEETIETEEGKE